MRQFPCNVSKSYSVSDVNDRDKTVWTLGPRDIDIVASLGDSITAATGAKAENILEVLNENRGSSYMTGADEDWSKCPTVHNFIRQFNRNVLGGSYGSTNLLAVWLQKETDNGLNLSVSAAVAEDLLGQAKELVRRVRRIRGWRYKWKMVSILIGHNDLCLKSCYTFLNTIIPRTNVMAEKYERSLRRVVEYLRSALPRTILLLLTPVDVTLADDVPHTPPVCHLARKLECSCLFNLNREESNRNLHRLWQSYRSTLYRISQDPTYNNKLFAVKFMSTFDIQTMPDTVMSPLRDSSLLAPDCFHFSKRLHARMARNLWNDLFQEDGSYGQEYNFDPPLFCPSQQLPYFNIKQFNKQ